MDRHNIAEEGIEELGVASAETRGTDTFEKLRQSLPSAQGSLRFR